MPTKVPFGSPLQTRSAKSSIKPKQRRFARKAPLAAGYGPSTPLRTWHLPKPAPGTYLEREAKARFSTRLQNHVSDTRAKGSVLTALICASDHAYGSPATCARCSVCIKGRLGQLLGLDIKAASLRLLRPQHLENATWKQQQART